MQYKLTKLTRYTALHLSPIGSYGKPFARRQQFPVETIASRWRVLTTAVMAKTKNIINIHTIEQTATRHEHVKTDKTALDAKFTNWVDLADIRS